MSDIFNIQTGNKIKDETGEEPTGDEPTAPAKFKQPEKTNYKKDHAEWNLIFKKLTADFDYFNEQKKNIGAVVLGIQEYALAMRILTKNSGQFNAPATINGSPIILIPIPNCCAVVGPPHEYWRELID